LILMNIRETLAIEHSKANSLKIADYIGDNAEKFADLMKIFFNEEYRLSQRAAYVFMILVDCHPHLIKPYLKKLISQLDRKDVHNSIRRNVVRALQCIEIPKNLEGKIFSKCVDFIEDMSEPIAIRAFALTVATRIAEREPELINELCLTVEKYISNPTPAFCVRIRKLYAIAKSSKSIR
jgi:hypothetical protein